MECFGPSQRCQREPRCEHACELRVQAARAFDANRFTCRTCRHWSQRYPKNTGLGECLRVSVIFFQKTKEREGYAALSVPIGMRESNAPVREQPFPTLNTVSDFGCSGYERKTDNEKGNRPA
jgi:hypothetical protein